MTASPTDRQTRKQNVIEALNTARAMELKAITQYMNQHYGLDNSDYGELAANMKLIAIDEMRHAEMFAERIKELGGEPTTQAAGPVEKAQNIRAVYPFDANLEDDTIDAYNGFLKICREMGDNVSEKLFETIIAEEQLHYNYFDNINEHITSLGDAYLSRIAGTPSSTGATTKSFALNQTGA